MPPRGSTSTPRSERFWLRVKQGEHDACWPWIGAKESQGYGVFKPSRQESIKAHRMAYELRYGPFDASLVVMHRCDNRICVNPSHLRLGTVGDNNRDRANKGRGRENRQWGADNPRAKLTEPQLDEIRALVASGVTQMAVAERFGIKQPHVSRIVRGRAWRHLQ